MKYILKPAMLFRFFFVFYLGLIGFSQFAAAQCIPASDPDLNDDGVVSLADLYIITSAFGVLQPDVRADINCDGSINSVDVAYVRAAFGKTYEVEPDDSDNPVNKFLLDSSALQIEGVVPNQFNDVSNPIVFVLRGADFYQDVSEIDLKVNGVTIPSTELIINDRSITAKSVLVDGRNDVELSAVDTFGRPLYHSATIWAGSNTLTIDIVDQNGFKVLDPVDVLVQLSDDLAVSFQTQTDSGVAEVPNLPFRTVLIEVASTDNRRGYASVIGAEPLSTVTLREIGTPSSVDNNDFSKGAQGWDINLSPVDIVPHVEDIAPLSMAEISQAEFPQGSSTQMLEKISPNTTVTKSLLLNDGANDVELVQQDRKTAHDSSLMSSTQKESTVSVLTSLVNNDLVLNTSGQGAQSISRTFTAGLGVTGVRIRYRFVTSEVPAGFFGSEFNDTFSISIRSRLAGQESSEASSMNGLGLGAFNGSGSTDWREVTLLLDGSGDDVQIDASVANVGDGLLDSQVVIDFVEEIRDQVRPSLKWNKTVGGLDLSYEVLGGNLVNSATISVYWANGTTFASRTGLPIFTHTVPAGTGVGQGQNISIDGALLAANPTSSTHLIATAGETLVGSVADVSINFGANANAAVVSSAMIDAIKDALRAAGQTVATITSSARTPEDQARAMFINLVNPSNSVAQNVSNQLGLYASPGDSVINSFVSETQGQTREQIIGNQASVRAAMVAEINAQGCENVSRHCSGIGSASVVDVGASAFNGSNAPLFVNAIRNRVSRFINETNTNGCYHLEL